MDKEKVIIKFKPDGEKIDKVTLLQLLLKKGVEIPFSCVDGFCGNCACDNPKNGSVVYKEGKEPLGWVNKDDEGNELQFLPCISKIDTKNIALDDEGLGVLQFEFPKEMLKHNKKQTKENAKEFIKNKNPDVTYSFKKNKF